jgi:hypothetical protein
MNGLYGTVSIIYLRIFLKFYSDTNDFEYSVFAIIVKWRDRSISLNLLVSEAGKSVLYMFPNFEQ